MSVGSSILDKAASPVNTTDGSGLKLCKGCLRATRNTKEAISNGLRLIRIRFGLPNSELPDLRTDELSRYLSYLLLQGKPRESVPFPRRQRGVCVDGFSKLQRLSRCERWEFAHSVSSLKRNLPSGCHIHSPSARSSWEKNAFREPPSTCPDYLAFVRREVSGLFHTGWDVRYESFVYSHVPNATSRLDRRRADLSWSGQWNTFRRICLAGSSSLEPIKARYKEVLSAGKCRPLLIFDKGIDLLAPLHKAIYSHLRSKEWLLCGNPTESRVSSVCVHPYQTSVDLVNATDNLSLEVTEAILGTLLRKSVHVPGSIKAYAFDSLRPLVDMGDGTWSEVTHGQMMGGYLSFPLLCLHSYLAASWATRHVERNILVNGDDTLISSSAPVLALSYPEGYLLDDLKTIRAQGVAEINSTAFLKTRRGWREVRHLRRGSFLADYPGMLHASAAVRVRTVWTDAFIRSRIGKKWGFLPSQLRLCERSYPGFCRTRDMALRNHTDLPIPENVNVPGLSALKGREADPDERLATTAHLFKYGRGEGRKRDVFSPSVGELRRGYSYMASKPMIRFTYLCKLAALSVPKNEVNDIVIFVPDDYVSLRDDRAIRELDEIRRIYDSTSGE